MSWGFLAELAVKVVIGYLCYTFGGALILGIPLTIYLCIAKESEKGE